jgi:uncharacterized FlaG/YvyC family protein
MDKLLNKITRTLDTVFSNTSQSSVFYKVYNNIRLVADNQKENTKVQREIRDALKDIASELKKLNDKANSK